MPQLQKVNGGISIQNNINLSSLGFFMNKLSYLNISRNDNLASINFNNLSTLADELIIGQNPILSDAYFPSLTFCKSTINIYQNLALSSISFPVLTTIDDLNISFNSALGSVSFTVLTTVRNLSIYDNSLLSNLVFSFISSLNSINISGNLTLNSISFPTLSAASSLGIVNNPLLSNLVFSSWTNMSGTSSVSVTGNGITTNPFPSLNAFLANNFNLSNNKFSSSAVNAILSRLVSMSPSLSGKYIDLYGQSPSAAPTGQGIIDKQTLINRGNTVYTD